MPEVKLVPTRSLPDSEHRDARDYWANRGWRRSYTTPLPYRTFIAEKVIAALDAMPPVDRPRRVLEFGSNVGLNLKTIRDLRPDLELVGVDINPVALDWGRTKYHLDLHLAEESERISGQPDDAFDVAYTVSVIDHIAKPEAALEQLARVAPVLLLIEPWFGKEGKVPQSEIPGTAPFSYSWDYPKRLGKLGFAVEGEPYILLDDARTLGPHYWLYTAHRAEVEPEPVVEEVVVEPEPVPPVSEPEPAPDLEPEPLNEEPVAEEELAVEDLVIELEPEPVAAVAEPKKRGRPRKAAVKA